MTRLAAISLALAFYAGAEQMTVRLKPPPWQPGGCTTTDNPACGWASAEDPSKLVVELLHNDVACLAFTDPVPPLSKVTSVDLRFAYAPTRTPELSTVYLYQRDGATPDALIGSFVNVKTGSVDLCQPPHPPLQLQTITGAVHKDGIAGYVYGGTNSLSFRKVLDLEFIEITMNFKRPPRIEFDLTDATAELERRVLIKQWRDDAYFSSRQASLPASGAGRDRRIRITGTVMDENGPVPHQTVYLRTSDPPDPSPYVPVAARVRGDNADGAGTLDAATVTSDLSGRFETVLTVTDNASGDNYQVEASTVSAFGGKSACDATNNCFRSGVITAWKRVFMEIDRMFRKGAMLRADVVPCSSTNCSSTVVIQVDDVKPIMKAKRLRIMHAPRFDGQGAGIFYHEDVDVIRVIKKTNSVEITRPGNAYFGPDALDPTNPQSYLADAVGQITGVAGTSADYYEANLDNLDDVMTPSYVDYVPLTNDPMPFLPFREVITGDGGNVLDDTTLFARKWFSRYGDDNVQHLLAVSMTSDSETLGRANSRNGTNYAYVFVDTVNSHAPKFKQGEWRLNGEVTVHEIGHLWQVNPSGIAGHCAERAYTSATAWCLMHGSYSDNGSCGGTCPEFYDGRATFHYAGGESEYTHIRRRPEPFPQF